MPYTNNETIAEGEGKRRGRTSDRTSFFLS